MTSSIVLRPYRVEDLDALIAIFRSAVRYGARRNYSEEQVIAWAPDEVDRQRWEIRRANTSTWVAETHGKLVGFADVAPDGHIDMLYVHADHHRCGIATVLLHKLEVAACAQGIIRLFTEASITARPFFEHHCFKVLAEQTVVLRGQELINYRMEKFLNRWKL